MVQFDIDEIEKHTMNMLKDFQAETVKRVDYLFRNMQNHVLVADEVGMGKTLIGRGVIVKTARQKIEEKCDLCKVVYICSNQNIANQNIRKLDITGRNIVESVSDTRLSMQHLKIMEQTSDEAIKDGFIQLIPLTPETSFRMTSGGGSVQERALIFAILKRIPDFKAHIKTLEDFMKYGAVKSWDKSEKYNYESRVAQCEEATGGIYPKNIIDKICSEEFEEIIDILLKHLKEIRYKRELSYSDYAVMNKLRVMFAKISVSMLEPDLVIMDEFQRFKFLISDEDSEIGILAKRFFSGRNTKVLLMSATPYKLYYTPEEIDESQGHEHFEEFLQVMKFIFNDEAKYTEFDKIWTNYSVVLRETKLVDTTVIELKNLAEDAMYQGVSRTERISVMDSGDFIDDDSIKYHLQVNENDINSYIQMSVLLSNAKVGDTCPIDYVKSCPYLMSFMRKYKIKEQIERYYRKNKYELESERVQNLLWLSRSKISKYEELPKTNARLESLKEKAFINGAEKYLWIPPSMPYYEMQGVYKNSKGFSKILVFSAWEMVPRMIGVMLSYESERLTVGKLVNQIKNKDIKNTGYFAKGTRKYPSPRLRFNTSNGQVRGMNLLTLIYPSKVLADMYSPIESLNKHESLKDIEKSIRRRLAGKLRVLEEKYRDFSKKKEDKRWYYLAPILMDGFDYTKDWAENILANQNTDKEYENFDITDNPKDKGNEGFKAHIKKLQDYLNYPKEIQLGRMPDDLVETLINMVLGSPAVCIYRSNLGNREMATSLAKIFIKNFNLPESTAIIELAYGRCRDDNSHWQNVLKYCKDGCFQAMIDEYIHMLRESVGSQGDNYKNSTVIYNIMVDSLNIRTATYVVDTYADFKKRITGTDETGAECRIRSSYAVGFSNEEGDNSKTVIRKENIRNAFNSPMRPFVTVQLLNYKVAIH